MLMSEFTLLFYDLPNILKCLLLLMILKFLRSKMKFSSVNGSGKNVKVDCEAKDQDDGSDGEDETMIEMSLIRGIIIMMRMW